MHRDDPAHMPVDERLDEIASLLAAGFLRLKQRTGCLPLTQRVPQSGTDRVAICELRSNRCVKGLPPDASSSPDSASSESAESSKIPVDSPLPSFGKPGPLCPVSTRLEA